MNKEFIEKIESQVKNINILDKDPFVEESCKNVYRALLVVAENENIPISDIENILNDANKTTDLLKKFDSINKEKYNGDLSYIVVDINNNQTLLYLIELLKQSINHNNESNIIDKQENNIIDNNKKINIDDINIILNSIFITSNFLKIEKIKDIKFLPSKQGYTIEVSDGNRKLYMEISEYGYVEVVRENFIDGKIIYMPDDDFVSNEEKKDIYTLEQKPWIEYLEIDEETGERKLRDDTPEEIVKKYNQFVGNTKNYDNITKFAQEHGYKGAKYNGKWKEYKVYEPYMDDNQVSYIGLPLVILVNDQGEIRMSTSDEAMAIIDDDSYMESFEENKNIDESRLKREYLLKVKDEFKNERNKYKDTNIPNNIYLKYLEKLESILNSCSYVDDARFIGRKIINNNWISNDDAIDYLFDNIIGNTPVLPTDVPQGQNLSDLSIQMEHYYNDGYVCSKEKDILLSIIDEIKKYINSSISDIKSIKLNVRQPIEQLTKTKIENTEDYITIMSKVKWEIPSSLPNGFGSFAIPIPYEFIVDGNKYNGIYELNDAETSRPDHNPKYNFHVVNLTSDGKMEVLIESKFNKEIESK